MVAVLVSLLQISEHRSPESRGLFNLQNFLNILCSLLTFSLILTAQWLMIVIHTWLM